MSFNPTDFRKGLGNFATGIAIISLQSQDQVDLGLTINSFSSVSLDPPLILWSIDNQSDLYQEVMAMETFTVSILNSEQEELSNNLSIKNQHQLDNYDWERTQGGIKWVDGCLAYFDCEVFKKVEAGDHVIIIGKVNDFINQGGEPLLYLQGQYAKPASAKQTQ